jgi:hypothetical protein
MDSPRECYVRADEDTAAAADAALPNDRLRLERSALAWRLRAYLLEREALTKPSRGR